MKTILCSLLTVGSIIGCGSPNRGSSSHTKDIATDLPDDGSTPTAKEIYYLVGSKIVRATCPLDATYFTRTICNGRQQNMLYSKFKSELDGGLNDLVIALTRESENIQTAFDNLQRQIRVVQAKIDEIEREQGGLSAELQRLRRDIAKLDTWIEEGRTQVANINERLRNAASSDLRQQRDFIVAEMLKLQTRLAESTSRLNDMLAQVAGIQNQLVALRTELGGLQTRATNLRAELTDVNARLRTASEDLSVYTETIQYLEDGGITYMVNSDTDWYQKVRRFVKRFDSLFDRLAV